VPHQRNLYDVHYKKSVVPSSVQPLEVFYAVFWMISDQSSPVPISNLCVAGAGPKVLQ
jgi:hypothetical protein